MKDLLELRSFFKRAEKEDLVLCTLIKKTGSSYRDIFAKKLISLSTNESCGLISGGCLEGAIESMAKENVGRLPFVESFSTLNEEDRLMGYQKGCAGEITILFEKVQKDLNLIDLYFPYGIGPKAYGVSIVLDNFAKREFIYEEKTSSEKLLIEKWTSPIELIVVGCGADADPYLELSKVLGWEIRFIDYRSDLAHEKRFGGIVTPELIGISEIPNAIPDGNNVAVVLMTHNFEADLNIFSNLLGKNIGYLGSLGPKKRFESSRQDLLTFFHKEIPSDWEKRVVKAPPGITPSNHTPSEIAFSIVADIQMKLGNK